MSANVTKSLSGVPIIPRALLFGNPCRQGGKISPDGKWLSWLAPLDGIMNIWLAPRDNLEQAKALTKDNGQGINNYYWVRNSRHIIYHQDQQGNENTHVFLIDTQDDSIRDLTPYSGCKASVVADSPLFPNQILIASNQRDPRYSDLYQVNVLTGTVQLSQINPGFAGFICDDQLEPRLAIQPLSDGGKIILRREAQNQWIEYYRIASENARVSRPLHLDDEGRTLYMFDSEGHDTAALIAWDLLTGERKVLGQEAHADIGSLLIDCQTYQPIAYGINIERNRYVALDTAIQSDLDFLAVHFDHNWQLTSRTTDDKFWTISCYSDTLPGVCYLYDRQQQTLSLIYHSRPEVLNEPLASMHTLTITSRDGLPLVCYLTLPVTCQGNFQAARSLPLVLLVHGGPWARDFYGFDSYHQWLSNRGYAVLSVNFRGSTGFGKHFINAGDGEWGEKMNDDLHDAVDHLISRKIIDPDAVAIMGGSYGGYAALSGLTSTPTRYCCAVDIVGPSNLETLLATIPPYWESGRAMLYKALGDPSTEQGKAMLVARSPLHQASKIIRPLLIGQGANDPRVKRAESDQMAAAMKENAIPVVYALYPDEGHGFRRPANNLSFNTLVELFLAHYLNGRAQPPDPQEMQGTTLQLLEVATWLTPMLPELGLQS